MSAYIDTGVLVKLYVPESDSAVAIALMQSFAPPNFFTHLHENEMRNAIRLKCARGDILPATMRRALANLDADFRHGVLQRPHLDWPDVFAKAEELSKAHALATNCRTLDALHVAAALLLRVTEFVSQDQRQRAMASKAGLRLHPSP